MTQKQRIAWRAPYKIRWPILKTSWLDLSLGVALAVLIRIPVYASPLSHAIQAQTKANYARALQILKPLAKEGNAKAEYQLGVMYNYGQGVPTDRSKAAALFQQASDSGYVKAMDDLGALYEEGDGVPKDHERAMDLYRKAADRGDRDAAFVLGLIYDDGLEEPRDYAQSTFWLRKACALGDKQAPEKLANMYMAGQTRPEDYPIVRTWLEQSANKGEGDSQFGLGLMFARGDGFPQDYVRAHMWFNLAAAHLRTSVDPSWLVFNPLGHAFWTHGDAVKWREYVATKMTPNQVAEAQRLASDWHPSKVKVLPGGKAGATLQHLNPETSLKIAT